MWRMKHPKKGRTGLEKKMAVFLDMLEVKYEVQKPFPGIGVVDFYLPEQHIAVEVDGGYWHAKPGAQRKDAKKDESLGAYGIEVIRVPGSDLGEPPQSPAQKVLRFG